MLDAFKVLKTALRDSWGDLWTIAICNLLWMLSLLLVVPAPPATLALFYIANRIAHDEPTGLEDFWEGLRRYWWLGWRWGVINLFLLFLLGGDIVLVGRLLPSDWGRFAQGGFIAALLIWLWLQIFVLGFLFEQEEPDLRLAFRNGAMMLGRNLGFSVLLASLVAALLALGVLLFMISAAAGGVFLALVGNHAVIDRLHNYRLQSVGG